MGSVGPDSDGRPDGARGWSGNGCSVKAAHRSLRRHRPVPCRIKALADPMLDRWAKEGPLWECGAVPDVRPRPAGARGGLLYLGRARGSQCHERSRCGSPRCPLPGRVLSALARAGSSQVTAMWPTLVESARIQIHVTVAWPLLLLLAAFVCGFVFIRISTRMIRAQVRWWPGNVTPGGMHIHHVVFGVGFMLVAGVGAFATAGRQTLWTDVLACLFGIGAALVLDEFALILHLEDVYWAEEGRKSVDAVILAAAMIALFIAGFSPLGIGEETSWWGAVVVAVLNFVLVLVAFFKGKIWTGAFGVIVPVIALVGAVRLARPGSPWARARYAPDSRKLARAQARERRGHERWTRVRHATEDAIAGRPEEPTPTGQRLDS